MQIKDKLWKAVIEEFFPELLDFFYKEFLPQIDLSKGFTFLDKELEQLSTGAAEEHRKADKLIKVFLKDGTERWLLVHIEVQGYQDPNFARRMFTTYYRLLDKFNQPIEALVIYTDKRKKHHYSQYKVKALKTELIYQFNSFEISDYTIEEYEAMENPFAVIFQTALLGLKSKWKDENLLQQKTILFRQLLKKGYSKKRIRVLSSFIKTYVNFSKPEFNRKFDEATSVISKNSSNMGIIETIQHINTELEAKGRLEGKIEGKAEAEIKTAKKQLLEQMQRIYGLLAAKISIKIIAIVEKIPAPFVEDFKKNITEEQLQILIQGIEKLYQKVTIDTPKKIQQEWLIQLLLVNHFSTSAIAEFLMISEEIVISTKSKGSGNK